jgi:hypothetical protein
MKPFLNFLRAPSLSPVGLVVWAGIVLGFHEITDLLGWREMVTILTGTIPDGVSAKSASVKAVLYLGGYFGTVVLVPILALAAGLSATWLKLGRRKPISPTLCIPP